MSMFKKLAESFVAMGLLLGAPGLCADSFAEELKQLDVLGRLLEAPAMQPARGFPSSPGLRAIYFDALPYKGKPTKVFAWVGLPTQRSKPVPGVVLVAGGGGTAYKSWVQKWNAEGFAAICVAVEGQTDRRMPSQSKATELHWQRHAWPGPARRGIYQDTNEPIADQWMFHAVADVILANSLLRSLPAVDAERVGIQGVSWGGVVSSTAVGLDPRFAFAIYVYGCGSLGGGKNFMAEALLRNPMAHLLWDPTLRMAKSRQPTLWLTSPTDAHFPIDCLAATARAANGQQRFCFLPGFDHSDGACWNRQELYQFARSVVTSKPPWCEETASSLTDGRIQLFFTTDRPLDRAVLLSSSGTGNPAKRSWQEQDAELQGDGQYWTVTAGLPEGTTAWFVNVTSGDLVASTRLGEFHEGRATAPHGPERHSEVEIRSANLRSFFEMDYDLNCIVTQSEFFTFWSKNFKKLDRNRDGVVRKEEIPSYPFAKVDRNKDGILTLEEDRQLRAGHFKVLDKNGDGNLTAGEMVPIP